MTPTVRTENPPAENRLVENRLVENHLATQSRPLLQGTLVRLRWFALAGQTIGVLFVAYGLKYPIPLFECLVLIGISTAFNIFLVLRFGASHRPATALAAIQLAFDSIQLAGLLWLTGGLQNPFSLLLIAPVSVSATILPRRETMLVGALTIAIAGILAVTHLPLPWNPQNHIDLPVLYTNGVLIALVCGIVFVTIYASRVAHEGRQLADALAATELALSRQQHLSALDGLAAAAAHELGTPLSTIALAAREMLADLKEELEKRESSGDGDSKNTLRDTQLIEDLELVVEQTVRCRSILSRLRNLDNESESPFDAVPISELVRELIRPFAHMEPEVEIRMSGDPKKEPTIVRYAGLLHGLGNLIENAMQFARSKVEIEARWDQEFLCLNIKDDGPGFTQDMLPRMGEPYLKRSSLAHSDPRSEDMIGLGLGVFIAKTLLMRTGATIEFANTDLAGHASVTLRWPVEALQKPRGNNHPRK